MNTTNQNSLRLLTKSILNRLENQKYIVFNPIQRTNLTDELFNMFSKHILTNSDLVETARKKVSEHSEEISEHQIAESEAFKNQKKALLSEYGEHELHGFYFKSSLKDLSQKVCKFLFDSSLVEDVFESDEDIQKLVVETIQGFNESNIA